VGSLLGERDAIGMHAVAILPNVDHPCQPELSCYCRWLEASMRRNLQLLMCRAMIWAAPVGFLGATLGMLHRQEPFYSWFYSFAWWSFIVFSEAWLHGHGGVSLLFTSPGRFLRLLPLSVNIWLVFEVFNFRLHNWCYLNAPDSLGIRWLGYTISFATVLPAIFTTSALIEHFRILKTGMTTPIWSPTSWYRPFVCIGLVFLLLPLAWPQYFFPLVWGGFIFLLEPLNHRWQGRSLMREWQQGNSRCVHLLLLAGACCGFLWEFWNFWAGCKWVYTIPYVDFFKIFEMPILGFLGFPPFAVECYVMVASIELAHRRLKETLTHGRYLMIYACVMALLALLDCWFFSEMDRLTVISYRGGAR
jgi:hypothetical protein